MPALISRALIILLTIASAAAQAQDGNADLYDGRPPY